MRVHRRRFLQMLGASAGAIVFPSSAKAADAEPCVTKLYHVPLDHLTRSGRTIEVPYIVVGKFDPSRRTVFIMADGQQFYIREDVLGTYRTVFGPDVNIIGLGGRGSSKDLLAYLGPPQSVNWSEAYQALRYEQWVHDADFLRKRLLGQNGKILLYGISGGGRLVHEFMTLHGASVSGVYSQSAVFEPIEAEFGLVADRFWRELSQNDRRSLQSALGARPQQADFYAQLLQRQNYFVDLNQLTDERHKLIEAIATNDQSALNDYSKRYQVADLAKIMASADAYRIRVREYELIEPLLRSSGSQAEFLPDRVVSAMWARPLLQALAAGKIPRPYVDVSRLNECRADALLVAGRYDHVADYRVSIALASHYPNHVLLLLNDDHQLHNTSEANKQLTNDLIRGWTKGFSSANFRSALAAIEPLRWRESAQSPASA